MRTILWTAPVILCAMMLTCPSPSIAAGSAKQRDAGEAASKGGQGEASQKLETPKDCDDIKAGTGGGGSTSQSAARKDCESSRHLGAGSGTSSGTGSGKMESGSGPR